MESTVQLMLHLLARESLNFLFSGITR